SRTLRSQDCPGCILVSANVDEHVASLRAAPGKDICLFGGGTLFRHLLRAKLVDSVEVAVMPVLLGGGFPLLPAIETWTRLCLTGHRVYPTGIVRLEYDVTAQNGG